MQHRRIEPGPGQESVWDYPRPPALDRSPARVVVELGGVVIASTTSSLRVLETSHPPVFYIPRRNVASGALEPSTGSSWCEFKGRAAYFTVVGGARREPSAAWHYPDPSPPYAALRDHVAFYAARMDRCLVDGEEVEAQSGGYYGGWVTSHVVGPFKGGPATLGW